MKTTLDWLLAHLDTTATLAEIVERLIMLGHDVEGVENRAPAGLIDIPADRLARLTAKQLEGVQATDAIDAAGHPVGAKLHGVGGLAWGWPTGMS